MLRPKKWFDSFQWKLFIRNQKSSFTVFGNDTIVDPEEVPEELITSYTVFLSPSPVNYTFDNIEDKKTEMTRLEISFAASFVSLKIVELMGHKWRFKHHFFKCHLYSAGDSESTVLRKLRFNFKYFLTFYFVDETITIAHNLEWSSRDTHTDKYSNNWWSRRWWATWWWRSGQNDN